MIIYPCPRCHMNPSVDIGNNSYSFFCIRHGYQAIGDTEYMARANWNKFIQWVITTDYPHTINQYQKEYKAIANGLYGISKGEL